MNTLYSKEVPITLKFTDREDQRTFTVVQIDLDVKTTTMRKDLHVQLTDESDPFFLFTLDLSEEDFQVLKNEQQLKPDFAAFPSSLIEKFESVSACSNDPSPRYICELYPKPNTAISVLNIIETGNFRNIVILSLNLRSGTDKTIKEYLAKKLQTYRNEYIKTENELRETKNYYSGRVSSDEKKLFELTAALEESKANSARIGSEMKAEFSKQISMEREKHFGLHQEHVQKTETEKRSSLEKYETKISRMTEQLQQREDEKRELLDQKYRLDADVKDLSSQLYTCKLEVTQVRQEIAGIRLENRSLDTQKHEQEKLIAQCNVRISALEQQVADKDELLSKMTALVDGTTAHKLGSEETILLLKNNCKELEERIKATKQEIKKGNTIISTLQQEVRSMKNKCKLKSEVIHRQQALVQEKENLVEKHSAEITRLRQQLDEQHKDVENLRGNAQKLRTQLEESKEVIEKNEQVIDYLQKKSMPLPLPTPEIKMPIGSSSTHEALPFNTPVTSGIHATPPSFSSSFKFRPKYQLPIPTSLSSAPTQSPILPMSVAGTPGASILPPSFTTPAINTSTSHKLHTENTIPTNTQSINTNNPIQSNSVLSTPQTSQFLFYGKNSLLKSTSNNSIANSPVIYNPPASQKRTTSA
eukprot:TRINITY_DN8457_c0_g3_i1.p1 TRINITY_DN8457_c0_g3~~TRINITY_DN8457_c0_g3_i1.p1  ORF type:complete len:645 (+),score=152.97 TRINITY_DN8457_c0_g3_i1:148-2082(+)